MCSSDLAKSLSRGGTLQRVANAVDLREIDADADDHVAGRFSRFGMTMSAATAPIPNTNPTTVHRFFG